MAFRDISPTSSTTWSGEAITGSGTGAIAGASAGGVAGGPVGAIIGGIAGAIVGGVGGALSTGRKRRALQKAINIRTQALADLRGEINRMSEWSKSGTTTAQSVMKKGLKTAEYQQGAINLAGDEASQMYRLALQQQQRQASQAGMTSSSPVVLKAQRELRKRVLEDTVNQRYLQLADAWYRDTVNGVSAATNIMQGAIAARGPAIMAGLEKARELDTMLSQQGEQGGFFGT